MKIFIIIILLLSSCSTATQRKEANDNLKVNSAITPRVVEYLENASSYDRASISNTHHRIPVAPDPANINFMDGTSYSISPFKLHSHILSGVKPLSVIKKRLEVYGIVMIWKADYYTSGCKKHFDKHNIILHGVHTASDLLYDQNSHSTIAVISAYNAPFDHHYTYIIDEINKASDENRSSKLEDIVPLPLDLFGIAHVWVVSFKNKENEVENIMILEKIDILEKE